MQLRSKKDRLASILMNRFFEPLLALKSKKHLSILAYHSIQPYVADYPFNAEIISAYPDFFDDQMAFVARYFKVTHFREIAALASQENCTDYEMLAKLPSNTLIITFDDGYADNLTNAMPIMLNHGLKAVIYISSDFVDSQKLFWFDEVAYFIRKMPVGTIQLCDGRFSLELDYSDREMQRRSFGRFLQGLSDQERLHAISELKLKAGSEISQEHLQFAQPLSWDQVRALRQGGMEIGSHTKSHGFLDAMNPQELTEQISNSKIHIEKMLKEKIVSFSYPNGSFHDGVVKAVESAGYSFAVNYNHSVAQLPNIDPFLLPRIHVETDVSLPLFKANLLMPDIFVR